MGRATPSMLGGPSALCRSGGKTPVPHFAASSLAARPQTAPGIFRSFRVGSALRETGSKSLCTACIACAPVQISRSGFADSGRVALHCLCVAGRSELVVAQLARALRVYGSRGGEVGGGGMGNLAKKAVASGMY